MRELRAIDESALEVMEGKIPYVYDDSKYPTRMYKRGEKVGGTLTAGVGHTGSDLQQWIGKTIPESQIAAWLDADNDLAERWVNNLGVPLNDNQFAAVTFWAFNVGVGAADGSTLAKKLRARDYDAVPGEMRKWTKTRVNGKLITSNGLIKRRADEIAYWLADNSNAPKPVPRPKDKPTGTQLAQPETPPTITVESVTTIIGAGSGIIAAVAGNSVLSYTFAGILLAAFAVGGYFFVTRRLLAK